MLAGCQEVRPARTVLAERCRAISGEQDVSLRIAPDAPGKLVVWIEQRGISVIASASGPKGGAPSTATSPVDRVGLITLLEDASDQDPVTVQVTSRDPDGMAGEVCLSAQLVDDADRERLQAEQAFAKAGQAVQARQWQTAFRGYLTAAAGYERLGLRAQATAARHALAHLAYWRLYEVHDSYALTSAALSQLESSDPLLRGALTVLLAGAILDMPQLDPSGGARARQLLSHARELFRSTPLGKRELPRLDFWEGFIAYQSDNPKRAAQLFAAAAGECRALGDWQCYAEARQNSAALAEEQKDYAIAMQMYEDALRALKTVPSPDLTADIADNLGRLEAKIGLFGRSERSRKTAMQIYARLGDCTGARRSVSSLGTLLMYVGNMSDASAYLDQAVSLGCSDLFAAISGASGAPSDDLPAEPAEARSSRTDPTVAAASTTKRCIRTDNLGTPTTDDKLAVFDASMSLSNALLTENDADNARRCVEFAREFAVTSRAQVRLAVTTGMTYLRQQQAQQASAAFSDALRIANEAALPDTYEYRGLAHLGLGRAALLAGRSDSAIREANRALRMSSERADIGQIIASLQLLAAGHRAAGHDDAAIRTLRLAVRLTERVPIGELDGERRATYLATQHAVFSELTSMLIDAVPGRESAAWEAFEISELGRARSLRYAASQAAEDASAQPARQASDEYRALLERVTILASRSNGDAQADLVGEIDRLGLDLAASPVALDSARIMKRLEQLDSTLVEYAAGESDMFAFVIDRGRIHVVRVGSVEAIADAAAKLNDRLRAPEPVPAHIRSAALALARLVLWPIHDRVTTNRIIFVPDDALHTVPFAVLPWSENSADRLLVHRAESTLLPAAALLTRLPPPESPDAGRFTLIGDPVFRSAEWRRECLDRDARSALTHGARATTRSVSDWAESLRRLPGTRDEVLAIEKLVRESRPGSRIETLIRCEATPSALRRAAASSGALLHIATHGRVDSHRPRLSALALTPDRSETGAAAVSLLDILNLKLHSKLVVLSACDTSRGRLLPGEGVLGLAQAFLQAGASSVLASYWRVEDDATANFMKRFYEQLIAEGMSASAALRQAQLNQAAAGGSYSWAAFSLYGSPDTSL